MPAPKLAALTIAPLSGTAAEVADLTTQRQRVVAEPSGILRAELPVAPPRMPHTKAGRVPGSGAHAEWSREVWSMELW